MISCTTEDILPTLSNPIGIAGVPLENNGDIILRVTLPDGTHRHERFTLITNLGYHVILGFHSLSSLGFALDSNDETVKLGQSLLPRISGMGKVNGIQQAFSDHTGAKFLCKSTDPLSLGSSVKNVRKCQQVLSIARPTEGQTTKDTSSSRKTTQKKMTFSLESDTKISKSSSILMPHSGAEQWRCSEQSPPATTRSGTVPSDFCIEKIVTGTDLSDRNEIQVFVTLLTLFENLFSKNEDDIGLFRATDGGTSKVHFEVRDHTHVVYSTPRRIPYARRDWLKQKLEHWCRTGLIQEVTNEDEIVHVSPVLIVPKKNNRYRMAVDYRELNKNLKPATCPLPNVKDCIEKLGKKKFFSALDLSSAFNQLELTDETKRLCGFVTLGKRYITHRMPFGANPCPAKFQEFIGRALRNVSEEYCTCYLDDILVASETFDDHIEHLKSVFKALSDHGLKLSPLKCFFFKESLEYLGFTVGRIGDRYGYAPLPKKIQALQELPIPETAKEVRHFCGALQYYNTMIPRLNLLLSPLHRGSVKVPFVMTDEMKDAFREVKSTLTDQIMLSFPDFDLEFKLSTDASYKGAAGILSQVYPDGREEIIYLFSKSFNDVETRWPIVELECKALVWSLEHMRVLLLGRPFTWVTDSLVLKQMLENPPRDLSRAARKISRYVDFINSFQMTIRHEKGTNPEALMADYLSRSPVLAMKDLMRVQITTDEWRTAVKQDFELNDGSGAWNIHKKHMFKEDNMIYIRKGSRCRIAVPDSLQTRIIEYYHEQYTIHAGFSKIVMLIANIFFWPNMHAAIRHYLKTCKKCIQAKPQVFNEGVRKPIDTPTGPWQWIQIDLVQVSNRQSDNGNRYILTSICTLTNFTQMEAIPTKEAVVVLKALAKIFCNTGMPKIIQSDNGREFKNDILQKYAQSFGVEWRFSTPYKPSTNGRCERRHADLAKILKLLNTNNNNWCEELPFVVFEINSTMDNLIGMTPFEAFHGGWSPHIPHAVEGITTGSQDIAFQEWADDLDKASWEKSIKTRQAELFKRIRAQRMFKKDLDSICPDLKPQLAPGDTIMAKDQGPGKLQLKTKGPYVIEKVLSGGSFVARDLETNKIVKLPASHAVRLHDLDTKEPEGEEKEKIINKKKEESSFKMTLRKRKPVDYTGFQISK